MRQKNSSKIEDILVPKQFDIRLWDTWEAPSLIVRLTRNEREALRRTFGIHWQDLDIHMKDIAECVRSGASVNLAERFDDFGHHFELA